ncbi:MAG: GAF domain-containing protein [Chloroflexi bacterium]|nr:GAF domain-containing protein [Chloroflexota bacterium]
MTTAPDNARLSSARDTERLITFQRITAMVAASLNVQETLDAIVAATCELVGTAEALIVIRDADTGELTLHPHPAHAVPDAEADELFRRSLWDGIGAHVMRTQKPHVVNDSGEPLAGPLPVAAQAWICVPLIIQDESIGLLYALNDRPTQFSDEAVTLATLLANHAAIAIVNARLFEKTESRLRASNAVFRVTQALAQNLSVDEVLQMAVEQITLAVPSAGKAVIHLLRGEVLDPRAASRKQGRGQAPHSLAMRAGSGIAGRALARKTPQVALDTLRDPDFIDHGTGVRSLIVVPLMVDDRVMGTLSVDSASINAFDGDTQRLVVSLGHQASVAISRARLFDAMRAEKRRIEAILNHMVDGVMLLDGDGRIANVNPALIDMVRVPASQLTGQLVRDVPYPVNQFGLDLPLDGHDAVAERSVQTGEPLKKAFEVFASPVPSATAGWAGHVVVVHDVTRERELDQLKSDFISTVSHELRTPLFSIRGFVKLLTNDKVTDDKTRREFLSIVSQQTDHLAQIVNDLLDLSRLDAGRPIEMDFESVDTSAIASQVVARFQSLAGERRILLKTDVPGGLPRVRADARRLTQALVNLVGNAIKFTAEHGRVTIGAGIESPGELRVSVTDTGIGIPADALPHLFERFFQVGQPSMPRLGGTGLGLYITRQIVEAHGGRICVESTLGAGSCFWFTIPVDTPNPGGNTRG